jgi:hypothetical protein
VFQAPESSAAAVVGSVFVLVVVFASPWRQAHVTTAKKEKQHNKTKIECRRRVARCWEAFSTVVPLFSIISVSPRPIDKFVGVNVVGSVGCHSSRHHTILQQTISTAIHTGSLSC